MDITIHSRGEGLYIWGDHAVCFDLFGLLMVLYGSTELTVMNNYMDRIEDIWYVLENEQKYF